MVKLGYWLWIWKKWTSSRDLKRVSTGFFDFRKRGGSGGLFVLYNHVFQDWGGFYFTRDQALIFNASPLCDPKLGILVLSLTCAGVHAKKLQVCLTVCDPKGCSPPGYSLGFILAQNSDDWNSLWPSFQHLCPGSPLNTLSVQDPCMKVREDVLHFMKDEENENQHGVAQPQWSPT